MSGKKGEATQTDLSVFLYTMNTYIRITKGLPVNGELGVFQKGLPNAVVNCGYDERDYIGICVRIMLQRKYFVHTDSGFIRKLILLAKSLYPSLEHELVAIEQELNDANKPFQIVLANGEIIDGIFENLENIVYGMLLHEDADKIEYISRVEEPVWMMYASPYVLAREKVLTNLYDLLTNVGVKPYEPATDGNQKATVAYWGTRDHAQREISGSPYWSNLVGRDGSDEELLEIGNSLSMQDSIVLQTCLSFIDDLKREELDVKALRKQVPWWTRGNWGDFKQAAQYISQVEDIGYSTKVRYSENGKVADVRLFAHVNDPFVIDQPQVAPMISVKMVRAKGKWKVLSITG